MSEFFIVLIVAIASVCAAMLFSDQTVMPNDIAWAEQSCAPNGGMKELSADIEDLAVRCLNGAVFLTTKKGTDK